jgi:hypothetical protein
MGWQTALSPRKKTLQINKMMASPWCMPSHATRCYPQQRTLIQASGIEASSDWGEGGGLMNDPIN